jgi:RNA polymerase sigma factor (sigma-70 family)
VYGAIDYGLVTDLDVPGEDDLGAARAGLQRVVADAFDAHQRELYAFALRASRDSEVAQDLVQEAFLRLLREVAIRPPENIRAWLYRVTTNLVLSRGRRLTVADRWQHLLVARGTPEEPESAALRHEGTGNLETALGGLSRDARTALLLAASGFTGIEIAAAIGRTDAATRTMMCRARLQMRERLDSLGERA